MAKCTSCNKIIAKKSPLLDCSRCEKIVHITTQCTGLSTKQLTALKAAENLEWTCNECNQNSLRRKSGVTLAEYEEEEEDDNEAPGLSINIKKLLQDIKKEVNNIITLEMKSLTTAVQYCSEKIDDFSETLEAMACKIKDVERKQQHLENKNVYLETKVEALEQRITEMEQKTLSESVEIAGIPEINDLDLPKLIQNIADKIQVPKQDIITSKRLPSKKIGPGHVIVKVRDDTARQRFITAGRETVVTAGELIPNLSGTVDREKIFIREALTNYHKNLLWQAKQDLKGAFKFVWCKEGKILARKNENAKIYKIRSITDIQSLLSNGK